jgi:hypothetical protein
MVHQLFGSLPDLVQGVESGDVPGLEEAEVAAIREFLEAEWVVGGDVATA